MSGIPALRRFVGKAGRPSSRPRCELCGNTLSEDHRHLVDLQASTLCCACPACALLFDSAGAAGGHYRAVGDRVLVDRDHSLTAEQWRASGIPVELAFLFYSTLRHGWFVVFPSPAGGTEAELDPGAWQLLQRDLPLFGSIEPDVEALLVRRSRGASAVECFVVPIDVCYRLIGLVRVHWRGFSGGDRVHGAIEQLFEELRRRSRTVRGEASTR